MIPAAAIAWWASAKLPWRAAAVAVAVALLVALVAAPVVIVLRWGAAERAQGYRAGAADVQEQWDSDRRAAAAQATEYRRARAADAAIAAASHVAEVASINRRLQEYRRAIRPSLSAPVVCPPSGLAVGDVVVPAAAMRGLRDASRSDAGARDAAPAASGPSG